ncbi:DUF6508 domain-containing protein [Deinococcus sp. MIMF12]|uniref:DUF6508 domain-containing protein n=1 Tax=Deinococcus rhizophilus TaxID=3049544 RepID=A0ABT7JG35_9DEIO|nr:DUF6508 domain-containing protein [Deinococcus rhizophilus]MDL2343460.1 DUF6508 domain-containing protein [Deinococcus rhizophilus]
MKTYSTADLQAVAHFLSIFEQEDFPFVRRLSPSDPTADGRRFVLPTYHRQVDRLVDVLNRDGWVYGDRDFRWPQWAQTEEARRLRDDPEALAQATPLQLARLLTIFVRQERFDDGARQDFWESGLLTGILRRAARLAEEGGGTYLSPAAPTTTG